ncbi:MAG: aldo/keto reductase [Chloroflexi bacterium HGW-Chloroflexi-1]|nr:MAG: aldo/keto reductase [Chloroflexi bacterium HGW-Chloroflexi-1]
MGLTGRATATGTARYAARFAGSATDAAIQADGARPVLAADHFRAALGLKLSSIGTGTYLGDLSDAVDQRYRVALAEAVCDGCNVLDTAVNYRAQRSEIALGQAVADLVAAGAVGRDELIIASKGGFIAHRLTRPADMVGYVYDNFIAAGVAEPADLAGGIHCMAPDYLSQQITWSLRNTGLHTLDIYYIHNPETQLAFVDRGTFRNRLQLAFARLEEEVTAGRISCYGIATWEGLRRPPMSADYISLEIILRLATGVAGPNHHLQVVQFPLSAAVLESATFRNQPVKGSLVSALAAARDLGLAVVTSASIMQAQAPGRVTSALREAFPALANDAQRALQFTRSLPGVTTALVGMGRLEHVRENLALAAHPCEPARAARAAQALAR